MTLKYAVRGVVLSMAGSCALAANASDPLYGEDAQALALLQCQAGYAKCYARAQTAHRATATQVATVAHAGCAAHFEAFMQSRAAALGDAERARALRSPGALVEHHRKHLRDYTHAHTLDVYLRSCATF